MAEIEQAGPASAKLDVREEDGTLVLCLSGDLDVTSTDCFRSALDAALDGTADRVIPDLAGLQFMDSSGTALIVSVTQKVREVRVRNPTTIVRRLFELTGLTEALGMVPGVLPGTGLGHMNISRLFSAQKCG